MISSRSFSLWLALALGGLFGLACSEERIQAVAGAGAGGAGGTEPQGGGGAAPMPVEPGCSLETERPTQVVDIRAYDGLVTALLSNGRLLCWGLDHYGECGWGFDLFAPVYAKGPKCLVQADPGFPMGVGLLEDGRVCVWGSEAYNSAGDGPSGGPPPGEVGLVDIPTEERVASVVSGLPNLALTENGNLFIWGDLALHITTMGDTFVRIERPWLYPAPAPVVAIGEKGRCFLTSVREVYCFGSNAAGKLGLDDPEEARFEPVKIPLPPVVELSEGVYNACALDDDGVVWCWGSNSFGTMGYPPAEVGWRPEPIAVPNVPKLVSVYAGDTSTCGIAEDGVAWCWTIEHSFGDLGDTALPAVQWRPDLRFVDIALGSELACGLTDDGRVYCAWAVGCGETGGWKCFIDIEGAILAGPEP